MPQPIHFPPARSRAVWMLALSLGGACTASPPEPMPTTGSTSTASASAKVTDRPPPELRRVPSDVADPRAYLQRELEAARSDGRSVLVYVGASWCEPCTRFHDALASGALDSELRGARMLELDHDVHERFLRETECGSKMIPLFAKVTEQGTCSSARWEGGIKGEGAVGYLLPKVKELL
jgi:hypothetical protein